MTTYIKSYVVFENIDIDGIKAVAGALLHKLFLDAPIPVDKLAEIVEESAIPLNKIPDGSIVKMARKEHVDRFFSEGSLRLGTFSYYNKFDHEEIGDATEGSFLLVGQSPSATAFTQIAGGFNYYVFCCYHGDADKDCIERFGYDSSFTIVDVKGFMDAVQSRIAAISSSFAKCAYSKDKVIVSQIEPGFNFGVISARLLDLATEAKYFVKPHTYSRQSEFRVIWEVSADVFDPIDIQVPEAIQYCRR